MKTNFKEYFKEKQAQKIIDKAAKKYSGKKIILYGAGLFAGDLLRNYDLSKFNIIGVADIKFQDNSEGKYYEYKKIAPLDLQKTDFDILLITVYDDNSIKTYFKENLLQGETPKFKIKTLIKLSIFEYIKSLLNRDF